ncbi:hypothetical protein ACJRO7_013315 [Eucalyptus globulus]|uniref:Uncharacterized protein n=1 Tax=Eucalyptus globulus TaxID=34317 RepID=A0ABD3KXB2_EUCGL
MDLQRSKAEGHQPASVLEGEGSYFSRILSREPSVGNSNRYHLFRFPGQIPFQWEQQPGKCKFDPPKNDHPGNLPRIRPPPVLASKSMELPPRPYCGDSPKGSSSIWLKIKFWRNIKSKKTQLMMLRSKNRARGPAAACTCSSNGSSCTSSDDNRMSSSSSNSSSSTSSSSTHSASSFCFAAPPQSPDLAKGRNHRPSR